MANTALNRTTVALLTNKSGGNLAYGAVVILDNTNAKGFTTTTTGALSTRGLGVIVEPNGIANDATGLVATAGWVPIVNLNTAATIGQFLKTHTVAGQATPHSSPQVEGDFAVALQASATPEAILFGSPNGPSGSGALSDGDYGDITVGGTGTTMTIDNDAVTYAKIQDVSATARVLGRKTAGAGIIEECTLSEVLDLVGSAAQGDILYRGAATWTRLAAGTSGHFLKTQGAGANPTWAAASGSATPTAAKLATMVDAGSYTGHTGGDFTTGIIFVAHYDAVLSGFKFAYDGFAAKTVKWTLWEMDWVNANPASVETNTQAVNAAGLYTITLGTPKTLAPGKFYTIGLYINDGSNHITFTTLVGPWKYVANFGGASAQTVVFSGPVSFHDIAAYVAGDGRPVTGNGTNMCPIELVFS